MKKSIIIIAAIFMTAFSSNVMAQLGSGSTVSANSLAASEIITPLTISKTQDMDFGKLAVLGTTAGTCVLSTTATRTPTGGVNLSNSTPKTSKFLVQGEASRNYALSLPSSFIVTNGTATYDMTVDALKVLTDGTSERTAVNATGTIGVGGSDHIDVGGTLHVAGNQPKGIYNGNYDITINYN